MKATLRKLLLTLFLVLISVASGKAQEIEWEPVNEGMWGGPVSQIVPYSDNTLFAIAGNGDSFGVDRVYRSRDRGNSWEALNTGTSDLSVAHLLVFPDGEILASTHQPFLLHSSNEGNTWAQVPIVPRLAAGLVLHPSGDIIGASLTSAFRSSDRGNTWLSIVPDTVGFVYDLDITPLGTILLTTRAGVFRSSDKGDSWNNLGFDTERSRFITVDSDSSLFFPLWVEGGIDSPNIVCAYRSQDDGLTWESITCPDAEDANEQTRIISDIGSKENKLILVAGSTVFISSDNGASWQRRFDFEFGAGVISDSFLWLNDQIFITMWRSGIVLSEDGGNTWQIANTGIAATSVTDLAQHPDGTLYASTERNGLFRSQDRGDTWEKVDLGEEVYGSLTDLHITEQGAIFVTHGLVYRSTDDGLTWSRLEDPCFGNVLATAPDGTLYVGGYIGLFYSRDNGESCELLTKDLQSIQTLAFASNGDILAGLASGQRLPSDGIFRSSDEGATWEAMTMSPPPPYTAGISELIITSEGTVLAGAAGAGIYRSEDGGYTFDLIYQPGLDNIHAFALTEDGTTYVAARGGVYRTNDEGKTWENVSTGIPTPISNAIMFDDKGFLYVGTDGAGIYRSVQTVGVASESERELPDGVYLKANFPNPFRQSTTIPFFLDRTAPVRVSIYNALGQEVDVVIQKILGPGEHQVQWAPKQQFSGLYFCHIQIDNRVAVRPLMFIH